MLSGFLIWSIVVFLIATCIGMFAVVRMKRSAGASKTETEHETAPGNMARWQALGQAGLALSIIALIIAIYLIPAGIYLPEDISVPLFICSLLVFPVIVALGSILPFPGYVSKRHKSSLAGLIVGGLAVVWLVASYLIRMTAFTG